MFLKADVEFGKENSGCHFTVTLGKKQREVGMPEIPVNLFKRHDHPQPVVVKANGVTDILRFTVKHAR